MDELRFLHSLWFYRILNIWLYLVMHCAMCGGVFFCARLIQFETCSIILSVLKVSLISTKPGFVWLH